MNAAIAAETDVARQGHAAIDGLRRFLGTASRPGPVSTAANDRLPFHGGALGYFSYDLGGWLEPASTNRDLASMPADPRDDRGWPLAYLAHTPGALVHDHVTEQWWRVGTWASDCPDWLLPCIDGSAPLADHSIAATDPLDITEPTTAHRDRVARTIEYIRAGDVFQANLTQRLSTQIRGSARALLLASLDYGAGWYGAYLEMPEIMPARAIVSFSPELLIDYAPGSGILTTRPIKGTRPSSVATEVLEQSAKDRAELAMIVDLMRNDLGRLCSLGSVQVSEPRRIETHPTVHHGVATVVGDLAPGRDWADILAAVFPAGSVTGAPKIRAMQIIEELEPTCRGPYCGGIGLLSHCGRLTLNVAIRTAALTAMTAEEALSPGSFDRAWLDYAVGGGIVADSVPEEECAEAQDKAAILRELLDRMPAARPHVASV
jgi:para-aminobenzoate synthetase component 1